MKYKQYEEYKESNLEWINSIPSHWKVLRNKYIFFELNERSKKGEEELLSVSEYYGVDKKKNRLKDEDYLTRAESLVGYKKCCENDLVINIMLAWKKGLGVSNYNGIVSPSYNVFRVKDKSLFYPRYFHYLFRTNTYADTFKRFSTGIIDSRLRLYPDTFLSLYTHVPPFNEQKNICLFLDRKCKEINIAIELKKQQIETLKKYQQSLITETVTKGLDPSAKMKDSGIEWIGEIPEQWEYVKLKYIKSSPMQYGATESGEPLQKGQPRYIRITDLTLDGKLKNEEEKGLDLKIAKPYLLEDGDILFARSGATVGKTFIYKKEYGQACFAGYLIKFTSDKSRVSPDFLYYFTKSNLYNSQVKEVTTQATIQNVSAEKYLNFIITLPSLNEQEEIIRFLDERTQEIDLVIEKVLKQMEVLTEYRQSLIYEAVTGKIDVRDYKEIDLEV